MTKLEEHALRPLESLSPDERHRLLVQLNQVVARTIDDLADIGRIDLIEPMHALLLLLRTTLSDAAGSEGFGQAVASVAQLIRTVRNVRGAKACGTFH